MPPPRYPVLDNHFHLDPRGRGAEAVKEFLRAGGTHLTVVHKPYRDLPPGSLDRTRAAFERTLALARVAADAGARVQVALAPHPAEFTEMMKAGLGIEEAARLYEQGLALAGEHARAGRCVALGEVGRPHYPVEPAVWARANALMGIALETARDAGVAVILHTESATPEVFADLAQRVAAAGLPLGKAVKHYSPPIVGPENHGLWPSIIASGDSSAAAARQGTRFLLETDYIDEPERPGAVLGPKTVPKRTHALVAQGLLTEEQAWVVHAENPARIYGVPYTL
ncbi:MAG TPA: TatD family hydrolase [Candidatus Thermoplasmatota archaeon]|jgi:TatD-related deoxyribonuclease|nr:TatD family hydrolase [Candidatus Thermoplasmatota archaeon]